ncbi:MAG: fumarylacetoacetate hydrolase family protein [Deltaproteobacteria bacterium]|nr:fumarylacetoacetate hydrolase family protein [Deltaproteobacteria bacterium]MBI3389992.1 fumarylacetoacetate hydrolase family protein [Deltaproteobacteria bacterium]
MSVRFANVKGRAAVVLENRIVDVERASSGRFAADAMVAIQQWGTFIEWARGLKPSDATEALNESELAPPVPRPAKVFAIGMNYRAHATEAGMDIPQSPVVFTKFPNCLVGPRADVELSSAFVDWEVELVVVIGRRGRRIPEARALDYVAGYTAGQDISDRKLQFADKPPQFSMGKSADTFGPIGPVLVTLDAFKNPNDLALTCDVAGERMQAARTSDMIFSVPQLIAFLSSLCTLEPGDLIFTGTPSGVGSTRTPRRYLKEDEVITSTIEGIGTLVNRCVAAPR